MKSFLSTWLAAAPQILEREFAGRIELRASAQLPQPETTNTLAFVLDGPCRGRFLITADRYALQALLAGARITDGSLDADRDRGLWCGILKEITVAAAQLSIPSQADADPPAVSLEDAEWTLGIPSAAYELRFGETVLLIAFTDETRPSELSSAEPTPEHAGEKPFPSSGAPASKGKIAPGGIDLLLDVELEASLRFGSREMPLGEVLDLGAGDVVELDRQVSDPVDLLVGDKIVARGEVVLINGSFGLRVLEIAEPRKCLESIRCLF